MHFISSPVSKWIVRERVLQKAGSSLGGGVTSVLSLLHKTRRGLRADSPALEYTCLSLPTYAILINLILHSFICDCDCLRSPRITPPFFLCCVRAFLFSNKGASFKGGYIACLPPSPRSIVVHVTRPPTLERPNFLWKTLQHCIVL